MRNVVLFGLSGVFALSAINSACSAGGDGDGFENDSGADGASVAACCDCGTRQYVIIGHLDARQCIAADEFDAQQ